MAEAVRQAYVKVSVASNMCTHVYRIYSSMNFYRFSIVCVCTCWGADSLLILIILYTRMIAGCSHTRLYSQV